MKKPTISFIGSAGIPNRYGGFEAFLEHCTPEISVHAGRVIVTCDSSLYEDRSEEYGYVERRFIGIKANGAQSALHDLVAFFRVFSASSHIVILGVSGGLWFPLFRLLCAFGGRTLAVNLDGVEWQRGKHSPFKRAVLRVFDILAQVFAHKVIIDNEALRKFLVPSVRKSAVCIAYPGDHVVRQPRDTFSAERTGLTICRIEPENNIEMMIEAALKSRLGRYKIVGNWNNSEYGRNIRDKYKYEPQILMIDAVYDNNKIAEYREYCDVYIHGHSVGGTNPSLVEMLFYDCQIICLDVEYHHETAGGCVQYFKDSADLVKLIDQMPAPNVELRRIFRKRYLRTYIAASYLSALEIGTGRHLGTSINPVI